MNYEMPCNPVPAADIPGFNFYPAGRRFMGKVPSAVYAVFIDVWL